MLKNYLKTALRNFAKHKIYSLLNIFGLAVGITCTILIIFYIEFEFSFDNFHKNGDKLFRISVVSSREGKMSDESPVFTAPIGPDMKSEFPEIKQYTRFSILKTNYFYIGDKSWKVDNISYADSTFFELFSCKLLQGKKEKVLAEPFSAVLTVSTAKRLFGPDNPVGQLIRVGNKDFYKVTGIAGDPPANSQIKFSALLSFSTLYSLPGYFMDWNGGNQYYTFLQLNDKTSKSNLENKFPDFMWTHINKELAPYKIEYKTYLQPLKDIHLKYNEFTDSGLSNIYIFSAVALLIMLIAGINFINLSIARATKRIKEIGVRKILGAERKNLFLQFISEYVLISFFVLIAVSLLFEFLYPYYQGIVGSDFTTISPYSISNVLQVLGVIIIVGLFTGGYPALYLSAIKPVNSLRGEIAFKGNKIHSRNGLLIVQFAVSVALIISTILISEQLSFIKNKDLGFDKNDLAVLRLLNEDSKQNIKTFKSRLESIPGVISSSASSDIPYNNFTSNGYIPEGFNSPIMLHVLDADADFFNTYGINITRGRNFIPGVSTDSSAYIINEALASQLNWGNPLGKIISRNGKHKIIGVVKNFNYNNLHSNIEPLIITETPYRYLYDFITIKIEHSSIKNTLSSIEKEWKKINPSVAFEYSFLDNTIDDMYKTEYNFRKIFLTFSLLAILLALLGLFSLSSLTTEQKTKEIGIRKVLGDTSGGITFRILKEYLLLVVIANVFGCAGAYYFISKWLNNFAFHITPGVSVFLISVLITMLFGVGVVIYHAVRAANSNPVESLRYE